MNKSLELHLKNCTPSNPADIPFDEKQISDYLRLINSDWTVIENSKLLRRIELEKFKVPMNLGVEISNMAEEQWHHPRLTIAWGFVEVEIYTHEKGGLLESDFIFAAKVDFIIESQYSHLVTKCTIAKED